MKGVGTAVRDAGGQVPAALAAARRSTDQALLMLRSSSTESLWLGAVFAAGAGSGLLMSRAPRLLTALAFVLALVFGGMVQGRGDRP